MKNIIPHLDKHFIFVCESMLSYHDGHHVRKNRKFLKTLRQLLYEKNFPTVGEVISRMEGTRAETTKQMIKSNIKRGGWKWLEGEDGEVFGAIFVNEFVRRCELIDASKLIEVMWYEVDRINHNNYPDIYPASMPPIPTRV